MATVSLCMIVKNEEKNIERALSWGKGIVAEQIVVDTGSEDRTVEIAESLGARVYHSRGLMILRRRKISLSARQIMSGLRFWMRMSISWKKRGKAFALVSAD